MKKFTLQIKGNLTVVEEPVIMGIINLTPDSFYPDSRVATEKDILNLAEKHLTEGADWLDLGAYSSRPGAINISEEEEKSRLIPAVKFILREFPHAVLSIDTFRSRVAVEALEEGAAIVNDITGGDGDTNMHKAVAGKKAPYILMHTRGTPGNMQSLASYADVTQEVIQALSKKINSARKNGICDIIIDPGFGFAKTAEQSFTLLKNLTQLEVFDIPVLSGISRKSMIYKSLKIKPEDSLNGTTVLNTVSLMNGAAVLRVHDVKEAVEVRQLFLQLKNS